ncbi:YceI family protein [Hoyosella rhizosphaerae]|uniref:Lipid/polyisoprenoid-binding YceI-like domain-containing protein n=1 Tax=Hoyosella rhizosphaerae TaxID=1755582 RepID=A0A916U061_9ACTN|nr:YceI family protein [Hoyosella rhizosphaerae]MBN4927247.1 YceI family protein [Hoyosella rhizosphaerae]GGC52793.1 hypothetical protein GCM10011410_01390 [Hoyosella rhizosphaerae]
MLPAGKYALGPVHAGHQGDRLSVRTTRAGIGAKVGHDLVIDAAEWSATVTIEDTVTIGATGTVVSATIAVASLFVAEAHGGVKPMSKADRKSTEKNMRGVLKPAAFPSIDFTSTSVDVRDGILDVRGEVALLGLSRPVAMSGSVSETGVVQMKTVMTQSHWGIVPFSAFLGALRLADDVTVEVSGALTPISPE